jgi:hypothetical protein
MSSETARDHGCKRSSGANCCSTAVVWSQSSSRLAPATLQRCLSHRVRTLQQRIGWRITQHTFRSGSAEPVGGVARFQTVVKEYRDDVRYADQPSLLTLFSGDAFNPSLESSITKGRHMVSFLNAVGTDMACVGVRTAPFSP